MRIFFALVVSLFLASTLNAQTTSGYVTGVTFTGTDNNANDPYVVYFEFELDDRASPPAWEAFRVDFKILYFSFGLSDNPDWDSGWKSTGAFYYESSPTFVSDEIGVTLPFDPSHNFYANVTIQWGHFNNVGTFIVDYSQVIYSGNDGTTAYVLNLP